MAVKPNRTAFWQTNIAVTQNPSSPSGVEEAFDNEETDSSLRVSQQNEPLDRATDPSEDTPVECAPEEATPPVSTRKRPVNAAGIIANIVRQTMSHNKMLQMDEMWSSRQKEASSSTSYTRECEKPRKAARTKSTSGQPAKPRMRAWIDSDSDESPSSGERRRIKKKSRRQLSSPDTSPGPNRRQSKTNRGSRDSDETARGVSPPSDSSASSAGRKFSSTNPKGRKRRTKRDDENQWERFRAREAAEKGKRQLASYKDLECPVWRPDMFYDQVASKPKPYMTMHDILNCEKKKDGGESGSRSKNSKSKRKKDKKKKNKKDQKNRTK
eukprot:Selendium_serpulae@DN5301_c0_g1_i2.p1